MRAIRDNLPHYALLLPLAAVLVWHALQFGFVTDDAFISFVYSRNFAEHGELTFNAGLDPVEGYTNFLWTLLLGALMFVGLQPEATSIALGIGFAIGTMVVVVRMMEHLHEERSLWDFLPSALLAVCSGFACWASGGLETQMFTFFVVLGLYFYMRGDSEPRRLRWAGGALALAAMTRPEGLLVAAIVGAHRLGWNLIRDRRLLPGKEELLCLGYFAAVWVPYFAWKWWYYGYPLPNTYYVKASGEPPHGYDEKLHAKGWYYVWQWARQSKALYAAPLALIGGLVPQLRFGEAGRADRLRSSRRLYAGTLAVPLVLIYLLYVVRVGGDFMGLHRFVMPVFVLVAVLAALGLRLLVTSAIASRHRRYAALGAGLALVALFTVSQYRLTVESMRWSYWRSDHGIDTPAFLWVYAHDRALTGKHLEPCLDDDDFVIFGGAGAQPYYARMRGIDVFGLVSEDIAHNVRPTNPRPGHNKWAPNELLLKYDPSFVLSCYSIHSKADKPHLNCNPSWWQRNGYELVTLHIPGMLQQGEYYTFLKRKDRELQCPGRVR